LEEGDAEAEHVSLGLVVPRAQQLRCHVLHIALLVVTHVLLLCVTRCYPLHFKAVFTSEQAGALAAGGWQPTPEAKLA
jgi:hypothetical protein